ncbi:MAG: beta-phosphoglucomutase [Lachnospiraceae bacterium]|nr:beta-phosphoglucomutase [Lachnospiraceae bacterium]
MKYQAIIFDLDGVICHTDQYHYQAWKQMADGLGIAIDESINDQLRGVSRMASLEIILKEGGVQLPEEEKQRLAAQKNELYRSLLMQMTPADLPVEVSETLQALRDAGIRLAIGSSSKNTVMILERLGLGDFFDAVSDGNQITHSKPDPEVFLLAADLLGVPAKDCLVVEDAEAGIRAAAAGGMDAAGIGAAVGDACTYRIGRFSELVQIAAGDKS